MGALVAHRSNGTQILRVSICRIHSAHLKMVTHRAQDFSGIGKSAKVISGFLSSLCGGFAPQPHTVGKVPSSRPQGG